MKKSFLLPLLLLLVCFLGYFLFFRSDKKKPEKSFSKFFTEVEFADKTGLILDIKDIKIHGVESAYNASIVRKGNHYLMAFRYDIVAAHKKRKKYPNYTTKIGIVELDQNFEQTDRDFFPIDTHSDFSEDPRLFVFKGDYYLIYNDRISPIDQKEFRSMHLAALNIDNFELEWITNLDQQIKPVEKNWVPIVHKTETDEKLFLGYNINPHKVLGVENLHSNELKHYLFPDAPSFYAIKWWKWGDPRGGTPAQKVDDEYLSFFHSFFIDRKNQIKYWYVMGAYTFEAGEPFRITRFSKTPILFSSMYSKEITNPIVDKTKRVAYPSGYVQGQYQGRDAFFVSIGENDSAIKILVIDKETLFKSLNKVN